MATFSSFHTVFSTCFVSPLLRIPSLHSTSSTTIKTTKFILPFSTHSQLYKNYNRPYCFRSTKKTKTNHNQHHQYVQTFMSSSSSSVTNNAGIDAIVNSTRFNSYFIEQLDDHNDDTTIFVDLIPISDWNKYVNSHDTDEKIDIYTWLSSIPSPPQGPIPIPSLSTPHSLSTYALVLKKDSNPITRIATALSMLPTSSSKPYTIRSFPNDLSIDIIEFAWGLLSYSFNMYKKKDNNNNNNNNSNKKKQHSSSSTFPVLVRLTQPNSKQRSDVNRALTATYMVRDMVTTSAEHFGPAHLEAATSTLGALHAAKTTSIVSDQLLTLGYPQVHRVGRAASLDRGPRILELLWETNNNNSKSKLPCVTLIGKGVCYDTGGLSIKPTTSMLTMKKDMAGAAQILGLAHMIMDANLPIQLRIIIPAIENSISSNSYRPGDVLEARNGITTLNCNSDAEGRLILADALVAAIEEKPDLIIDCATLTGAQRVAMGPDIPSFFSTCDDLAIKLSEKSRLVHDLMWHMPLYEPYRKLLDTPLADIKSCSSGSHAGCITAALYLKEFITDDSVLWIHVDMMGYNSSSSPGRPEGGEAMGMRALFELLRDRYPPLLN